MNTLKHRQVIDECDSENPYFALGIEVRCIAISVFVCLSVCLFVCMSPRISQKRRAQMLPKFATRYLWLRLGYPLTAMKYVTYFRFCERCCFHIMERIGQNQRRCFFVEFAGWRLRGKICRLRLHLIRDVHRVTKKGDAKLMAVTLSFLNRFSKFFH